jgi:hypothetical protein
MASQQERDGRWQCQFIHCERCRTFALGRISEAEARAKADQVEYLLMRLDEGLIALPPGADIVTFVRHDGTIPSSGGERCSGRTTLASFRGRYLETHGNGTLEAHTLRGINRHFRHLTRELGDDFPNRDLSLRDLQRYVDRRAKAKARRGTLDPATIQKEIDTLRPAWK